ncbi:hypothetical protein M3J09_002049 [Ascochyta lentis]
MLTMQSYNTDHRPHIQPDHATEPMKFSMTQSSALSRVM